METSWMDKFFDRLGEILRSIMGGEGGGWGGYEERDADMQAALDELDEYLRSGGGVGADPPGASRSGAGQGGASGASPRSGAGASGATRAGSRQWSQTREQYRKQEQDRWRERQSRYSPRPPLSEELKRDYANLEVPVTASFEEVKRAHKRLMQHYHPDRFGQDPEKLKIATEITQKLNESFSRIEKFHRQSGSR
jgi:hypothetical protein